MNDDEIELRPPTPHDVARRALVLAALVCRGNIDSGEGVEDAEKLAQRLRTWLKDSQILCRAEPWEVKIFNTDLGALDKPQVARATWAVEGLAVLAWALRLSDFPLRAQCVDKYSVTGSVGLLSTQSGTIVADAELRDPSALRASRELMYAIHCRLREFMRHKKPIDFTKWIEQAWLDDLNLDASELMVGMDLKLGGKSIVETDADSIQQYEWCVRERHRASIWLIGEEFPTYWDWTVDT